MPWLVAIAALCLYEAWALKTGRTTLSRMVWRASAGFPLLPFLVGLGLGILAAHLWWGGAFICYDRP